MRTAGETNDVKAIGYGLLTIASWSTVATAFSLSLRELSPFGLLLWSSLLALAMLAGVAAATGRVAEFRRWTGRDFVLSAAAGLLNPFLYYFLLFGAYDRLAAQDAMTLNFTWPIVLVIVTALLFRRRVAPAGWLFLAIGFCGVVTIATRGRPLTLELSDGPGVAMALGSTVVWALYWAMNSSDSRDSVNRLLCNFAFGCAYLGLFAMATGGAELPGARGLIGAAWVACFEMAFAFVVWLRALKLAGHPAWISNLVYLTPVLSLLVIRVVLGESIHGSTLAGLALILTGVAGQGWLQARPGTQG